MNFKMPLNPVVFGSYETEMDLDKQIEDEILDTKLAAALKPQDPAP